MCSLAERNRLQFREKEKKTKFLLVYFPISQMGWSQIRRTEFIFQINNRRQQFQCKERAVRRGEETVFSQENLVEVIESLLNLQDPSNLCVCVLEVQEHNP